MKRLFVPSTVLAAGVACLVGCGDENTTEITQVVGMQVLEKGEALPKCTADNEGAMVFSVDSAEAFYCIDKKWKSMKGEKGEDGKKGTDGKAGSDGADGKDGSSCTAKALKNGKGYKIVCGGDSVGVVLNGEDGQDGAKGDSGIAGEDGLSAYEIAKAAGYKGTEAEWIASLKGDSGAAGTSCTAEEVTGGIKISCTDGKSYTLRDGIDGSDGKDGKSFVDGWMVDPRDKQLYRVVSIGNQIWMAENLNFETETDSYCYNGIAENCKKYGRHYTWAAAVGKSEEECGFEVECDLGKGNVRGVCPEGWHLPDTTEWNVLFATVGGIDSAGTMLKSTEGWAIDGNGTDNYGFSALPAGYTNGSGISTTMNESAIFWSSTAEDGYLAYSLAFLYKEKKGSVGMYSKFFANSVRCIKD